MQEIVETSWKIALIFSVLSKLSKLWIPWISAFSELNNASKMMKCFSILFEFSSLTVVKNSSWVISQYLFRQVDWKLYSNVLIYCQISGDQMFQIYRDLMDTTKIFLMKFLLTWRLSKFSKKLWIWRPGPFYWGLGNSSHKKKTNFDSHQTKFHSNILLLWLNTSREFQKFILKNI